MTVGSSSSVLAPGRTWAITTTSGSTTTGYLPGWAGEDPSTADVPIDRLPLELADVAHRADVGGLVMPVSHAEEEAEEAGVLVVTIGCKPFDGNEDSPSRVPVMNVQIVDDFWIRDLDPAGAVAFGERLRVLGELVMSQAAGLLAAARSDWAAHSSTGTAHVLRTLSEGGTARSSGPMASVSG
ncbi:DUF6907 domain-containing protein [Streptomyces sp. NBC_01190]|uniref:DUF6907 domain-containing protein n=1 Tax=Streptomyces sp. NBC_01190 TaxID=2903767 RepID=UPI0038638742|nr:hypothetical protein OG519_15680 [Streptomyces sp. NBC_01190]